MSEHPFLGITHQMSSVRVQILHVSNAASHLANSAHAHARKGHGRGRRGQEGFLRWRGGVWSKKKTKKKTEEGDVKWLWGGRTGKQQSLYSIISAFISSVMFTTGRHAPQLCFLQGKAERSTRNLNKGNQWLTTLTWSFNLKSGCFLPASSFFEWLVILWLHLMALVYIREH